jgi:hypothetical protein
MCFLLYERRGFPSIAIKNPNEAERKKALEISEGI